MTKSTDPSVHGDASTHHTSCSGKVDYHVLCLCPSVVTLFISELSQYIDLPNLQSGHFNAITSAYHPPHEQQSYAAAVKVETSNSITLRKPLNLRSDFNKDASWL
ncbi:hypothetical protein FMEXI_1084 [Fusarium mexicanum]|uniref:Uncharacterized protein n=1 Tax=Fusarium mexicanum TaxID=751941 RepID=A0A8H5N8I0_9HYPO|nr:hypothetical protein FMEXI_1084 [Fusarium mexicanum]